jgi:hypothetical protein
MKWAFTKAYMLKAGRTTKESGAIIGMALKSVYARLK